MRLAMNGVKFYGAPEMLCIRAVRSNSSSNADRGQFFGIINIMESISLHAPEKYKKVIKAALKRKINSKSIISNSYQLKGKLRILLLKLKINFGF